MGKDIFDKLINSRKMPVLFIGSGISKRYLYNFPDWDGLLKLSFSYVDSDPYYYGRYFEKFNREDLTVFERNTKLASIIENDFNEAFYSRKIQIPIGNRKNPKWVEQGVSPYKMFLVDYFRRLKVNKDISLQEEMDLFRRLKNKIAAVITTNYDEFLEKEIFQNDYSVFCRQNELFSADSYNIAEIYKIHGSIKDAKSIVITERDYKEFDKTRKLIIAKMLTLFTESPIIFMGYSFNDENIHKIIEDFLGCLTNKELKDIADHFIFINYKENTNSISESKGIVYTSTNKEIPITEVSTSNYALIFKRLNEIIPGIAASRIRETKRIVKRIVDQSIVNSDSQSVIVGIDDLDDATVGNKPLAIAIGYRDNILNRVGYGILETENIIEDIIYNNKNLSPESMCFERFKTLPNTYLMPVFKYVSRIKTPIPAESKLGRYVEARNSIEKIISKNQLKVISSLPSVNNVKELREAINEQQTIDKKAGVLLKNISLLCVDELREECKKLFELNAGEKITSTCFKRCVMCLDFKENYLNKEKN